MDGTGKTAMKKRIIQYGVIWLILVFILSAVLLLFAGIQERNRRYQLEYLLESHPELEPEIIDILIKEPSSHSDENGSPDLLSEKYGYDFVTGMLGTDIRRLWVFLILIFTIVIAGTGVLSWCREKYLKTLVLKKIELFYEQLERFREGEFSVEDSQNDDNITDWDDGNGHYPEYSKQWMKLWETTRELGEYFSDLKERLQAEEESTKALITNISHQLKTPLASLRMSHELVLTDEISETEKSEFLVQEEREIDKLEMLLEELVNLSRLEKHMIQIKVLPCSLKQTITDAVNQIYRKAMDKEIEISLEMEEDVMVFHDVKWTTEALSNILDNAVKYSGVHTSVEIRVQKINGYIKIEIADHGMGIPKEELHCIYQRFYRGRKAAGQVKEGAGVGLYLARMIIEQQKGTISAKSRPGQGTVFTVMLPFKY